MEDEKLEQILNEYFMQEISPSEKLLKKTKRIVQTSRSTKYVIGLCVLFNVLILNACISLIFVAPFSLLLKLALYLAFTGTTNLAVLAIYLYRQKIKDFMIKEQLL